MSSSWLIRLSLVMAVAGGCAATDDYVDGPDDDAWLDGKADGSSAVDVQSTNLDVDLAAKTAVATIELEKYGNVALEAGGLTIKKVTDGRGNRRFRIVSGKLLVSNVRSPMVVEYGFAQHTNAD